jgi:multicomponent K+:H+ antiporter subunit A
MLMRPLLPLALTVSVYILLRGHNLPGGGFVAGLITSVALVMQYLANGIGFAQARLPDRPDSLAGAGPAAGRRRRRRELALWVVPFLTSAHGHDPPAATRRA